MLNQIVIVGRLTHDPEIKELEEEKKRMVITIACPRPYKNADGIYETDFVDCILWNGVAENTAEYCHKGDIVGVKGRLQTNIVENEDGTKTKYTDVIAEKITFLSSKKQDEEE